MSLLKINRWLFAHRAETLNQPQPIWPTYVKHLRNINVKFINLALKYVKHILTFQSQQAVMPHFHPIMLYFRSDIMHATYSAGDISTLSVCYTLIRPYAFKTLYVPSFSATVRDLT